MDNQDQISDENTMESSFVQEKLMTQEIEIEEIEHGPLSNFQQFHSSVDDKLWCFKKAYDNTLMKKVSVKLFSKDEGQDESVRKKLEEV